MSQPKFTSGERRGALILAGLLLVIALGMLIFGGYTRSNPMIVAPATEAVDSSKSAPADTTALDKKKNDKKKRRSASKNNNNSQREQPASRCPLDEIIN